jgi:small subunit ribosomal protein S4
MRYIWPKRKLCRREKKNLFWSRKYDLQKTEKIPWQHGAAMQRLSDYGKLLRNKQAFKRSYWLSEKQFSVLVKKTSKQYAKNHSISHDIALMQFLERRCDVILLRAGVASTMMQARQMISHWHWLLDWIPHNVPSHFMSAGQKLVLKKKHHDSWLYQQISVTKTPLYVDFNKSLYEVHLKDMPHINHETISFDVLKTIEFYARA